jgi:hypothetical protein
MAAPSISTPTNVSGRLDCHSLQTAIAVAETRRFGISRILMTILHVANVNINHDNLDM